jgi:predicted AAA+ superfamily ATPase
VNPLTYREFYDAFGADKHDAWREFFTYGGMPAVMAKRTHEEKSKYLKDLFEKTYITDVVERHRIQNNKAVLEDLLNLISSAVGSLTNAAKLSRTFDSVKHIKVAPQTISTYLDYFVDAFLVSKSYRYDIKGKRYIGTPLKYYFTDVGLRNARLNFRQQEENHIMENIIYNELAVREYDIDVGSVEYNFKNADGKSRRSQLEVDFVANKGSKRYYIQSALTVAEEEKRMQETGPLNKISDSFKKIVVVKDDIIPWHDEYGVLYIGAAQFLLDEDVMDM